MFQGVASDRVLMYEKQEQEKDYLSKMKHIAGDFNHFNRKYSLEQNKRYYQKKHKGQTEDVKAGDSRPTGGGGPAGGSGRPSGGGQGRRQGNPSNSNSTSSSEPPTEQARHARELDLSDARDANLDTEEMIKLGAGVPSQSVPGLLMKFKRISSYSLIVL